MKRFLIILTLSSACVGQNVDLTTQVKGKLPPANLITGSIAGMKCDSISGDGLAFTRADCDGGLTQITGDVTKADGATPAIVTMIRDDAVASGTPSVAAQAKVRNRTNSDFELQSKSAIEVRDLAGVDCTGTRDSSTALNALTNAVDTSTGKTISSRGCAKLRIDSQWLIFGQAYIEIDGGGTINTSGALTGGTKLYGCNGSGGALILVKRSGHSFIHGFSLEARGPICTSRFTRGIEYTNPAGAGYTSTKNRLKAMAISSNWAGVGITNFVGYYINGTPNQEGYKIEDTWIHCQGSAGSYGVQINDANADSTELEHVSINNCYRGIYMQAGRARVYNSDITGNGGYSVYGSGGATIYSDGGCVNTMIETVVAENSGQFLNSHGDATGLGCDFLTLINNQISFQDIDPGVYPVNIGNVPAYATFIGNKFQRVGTMIHNNTLIGTDSQAGFGPLGALVAKNNTFDTTYFDQYDYAATRIFQNGEDTFNNVRKPDNAVLNSTRNASSLLGNTWAVPGAIGRTMPNTGNFTSVTVVGANGETWVRGQISELITLSTSGTTTDSASNLLPSNSIIEAVVARVTTTITTATDWKLGDAATAGRFSPANHDLTAGTAQVGTVQADQSGAPGPRQISAAKLRITTTGTPGAGVIRVTVFYRQFVPPTS